MDRLNRWSKAQSQSGERDYSGLARARQTSPPNPLSKLWRGGIGIKESRKCEKMWSGYVVASRFPGGKRRDDEAANHADCHAGHKYTLVDEVPSDGRVQPLIEKVAAEQP